MARVFRTFDGDEKYIQSSSEELKVSDLLGDLGTYGKILLKWI